jgi:hypothetical protein
MQYHEVRVVVELREQGEHEWAEEFGLKAMRRTPRRIPTWCPWLAPLGWLARRHSFVCGRLWPVECGWLHSSSYWPANRAPRLGCFTV